MLYGVKQGNMLLTEKLRFLYLDTWWKKYLSIKKLVRTWKDVPYDQSSVTSQHNDNLNYQLMNQFPKMILKIMEKTLTLKGKHGVERDYKCWKIMSMMMLTWNVSHHQVRKVQHWNVALNNPKLPLLPLKITMKT